MSSVGVVDIGLSNIDSVRRAFEECGAVVGLVTEPRELAEYDRLVLPGVGAFADAMRRLRSTGLECGIREVIAEGRTPLLGVCLGMQLLVERGSEGGDSQGLGLIPGEVSRLEPVNGERVPHIGWNEVNPASDSPLFAGIEPGGDFYFVHSFEARIVDPSHAAATTPYAGGFCSAVSHGLVHGVQFHPEKSQRNGFAVVRNFLEI